MKQMFFWNSLAYSMIQQMLAIWSLVPLPFLKPAWTFSQFMYCWSLAWRSLSIWEFWARILQYSCLESLMDRGAWLATVYGVAKSRTRLSDFTITSMWDEWNCAVVWAFFGIAFLWVWNENWPFPVLWPLLSVPNLLAYWLQHFHSIIFQDLKKLNWNSITSPSFVLSDAS